MHSSGTWPKETKSDVLDAKHSRHSSLNEQGSSEETGKAREASTLLFMRKERDFRSFKKCKKCNFLSVPACRYEIYY